MLKRQKRSKKNYDKKVGNTTVKFYPQDKVLIRKHVTKNKADDRYRTEIYEIVHQKDDSVIYLIKSLESSTIKSIHRDNMILFRERTNNDADVNQFTNIKSWQQTRVKYNNQLCEDAEFGIKKDYNNRIGISFGD